MTWWDPDYVEDVSESRIRTATFHLHGALETLTAKQRFVIELRFGLRDGVAYSLDEIAEAMGVAEQTVWDIERTAMTRLRGY